MGLCPQAGITTAPYRSTGELRADMRRISEEIREAEERMNVRELTVSDVCESENPRQLVPMLKRMIAEANEARGRLVLLEEDLNALCREWEESRCFWR